MTEVQSHLAKLAVEPADHVALQAVETAYAEEGRWEELLRLYEVNAVRLANGQGQAAPLLRKAAMVCLTELASTPRAEGYLRQALADHPQDTAALQVLRQIYVSRGEYDRASEVYELEIEKLADPSARAAALVELAQLWSDHIDRPDRALVALKQAQRLDPNAELVYGALAALYENFGNFEKAHEALMQELRLVQLHKKQSSSDIFERLGRLAERLLEKPRLHELSRSATAAILQHRSDDALAQQVNAELTHYKGTAPQKISEFEQRAAFLSDGREAADNWLSLAELALVYGSSSDQAAEAAEKALVAFPGYAPALRLFEEIYASADRYAELAIKLEMMATYAREPRVAIELYLKAALHYAIRLDNPDASARLYSRVLHLDPGNKGATMALSEYYGERKDWQNALNVCNAWASRASLHADRVAALHACCRILTEELNDKVKARPYYEAILEIEPNNHVAALALEEIVRKSGDHQALAKALAGKLQHLQNEARIAALTELAQLYTGPVRDAAAAFNVLSELFTVRLEMSYFEQLQPLVVEAHAQAAWTRVLEAVSDRLAQHSDRVHVLKALAEIYENTTSADAAAALRTYRRILTLAPDDQASLKALERLVEEAASAGDKLTYYRDQVKGASSGTEKVALLKKLANEQLTQAHDVAGAIDAYRQVLSLAPNELDVVDALIKLYSAAGRTLECCELLQHKIAQLSTAKEQLPWRMQLAQLLEVELNDVEGAAAAYQAVLAESPTDEKALTGLERLLGRLKNTGSVAQLLQGRYESRGNWDKVALLLEMRLKDIQNNEQRVPLLLELAEIYQKRLSQLSSAQNTYLRALQIDPANQMVLDALEKSAASNRELLVPAYRAAAMALSGDAKVSLLIRSGTMAEQLGDGQGALLDCLGALAACTQETAPDALIAQLSRLLKGSVTAEQLSDVAAQALSSFATHDKGHALYWRRLARLFEQELKNVEQALLAWRNVLETSPQDQEALGELERLYASAKDVQPWAEHLRNKLQTELDDTARLQMGLQLADLLSMRLGDDAGAIEELVKLTAIAPAERALWQRLSALYHKSARLANAAESMQRELALIPEGDDRRARSLIYASLVGKELGDIPGALLALQNDTLKNIDANSAKAATNLLEELLSAAPTANVGREVRQLLTACYRAAGRFDDVASLLASDLTNNSDAASRVESLRQLANVKAHSLGDADGAYRDLERAFVEAPADATLRSDLERLAEVTGNWQALADVYSATLPNVNDAQASAMIRRKLAEVLDSKLGRGDEAIEHYRSMSAGQLPDDLPSLEALERLLRGQNRGAELVEVISLILDRLPPATLVPGIEERRKTLLLELGHLCEHELRDLQRAAQAYTQLIELDARNVEGLRRLARVLGELKRSQEWIEVLDKLVELGPLNANILDDLVSRASACIGLGNYDEALKSYRSALLKKREYAPAVAGLEALVTQIDNKLDIAQVLEPIYTARQDHQKLAWILEQRLASVEDLAQRKGLLRRIGDIFENRLQQKEQAFVMARRSLGEDPSDLGVRMWIEKLAGETNALADLAQAYVEEAQKAAAPLNLQFYRRAAALYHEKLQNLSAAVEQYNAILNLEARDEKAVAGLESIFRATENYRELVGVLTRRLKSTAGVERKREYLSEIATLQAERLNDFQGAIATQREILQITPEDAMALIKIEAYLSELKDWQGLAQFYEAESLRLTEKRGREQIARRLELTFKRGVVIDEHFGDQLAGAEIFAHVLEEDPVHAATIAYLEQRAATGGLPAIELLEKVYRQQGDWKKYVALLESKLGLIAESEVRRGIYLLIAQSHDDQFKDGQAAFNALTRAYNELPGDNELLELLSATAAKYNGWAALVGVLSKDIDAVADAQLRQDLLHRLGDICGNRLNDTDAAIGYLQHALQYDPSDEKALAALDALLLKNEKWAALADVIERRIEVATEPRIKSQMLERLATVWGDKLMDSEAALRCHQQILDIDPDHPFTLKSMQKLYADVQDWDTLAKNLQRQSEVLSDDREQVRIHSAAGALFAEELGDNKQAIEHWFRVVAIEPGHSEANKSLDVLLTAEERWEDLAEHYRRQLAHTPDPASKLEINRRLGIILGEKLGRKSDALESWLKVLEHDAKNIDALRALLGLYSERAMWDDFVSAARRIIPLADPGEAKEVRFLLAKALGENLGQRDEAIRLSREVRATEPHTPESLLRLGEMLGNIESWDEAVICFEKAAVLQNETDAKVETLLHAAMIYRDKLARPNEARNAYEALLQCAPAHETAYLALAEIYRNTQEWRKLVQLNESFVVSMANTPSATAQRLTILTEIRDVLDAKLAEKDLAFIAGCRVFKEDPSQIAAADTLERIAIEARSLEELVAVLEDELDNITDTTLKIGALRRIARIQSEELHDVLAAEGMLGKILVIAPNDIPTLDELAALAAREERYDKQIVALEAKLQAVGEDSARKSLLFDIARIWEDKVGDTEQAIGALNRILEIDGVNENALDEAARIFNAESRWFDLARVLTRRVENVATASDNIQLRMRIAALCEAELGDTEEAISWYRSVLDYDKNHAGALESLERLYTGLERWSELIQIYELRVGEASASEEKIRLLSKMATIYEANFDSARDACGCFERIFQIDATHAPSLKSLERLLRALAEWSRLIEVLQHHITLLSGRDEITAMYLEIGEIYYKEMGRVDKAEQIYSRARELNAQSTAALHSLGKLYERSGNWFQALDMMQQEATALGNDPAALALYMRIGKINEDMLSDLGAATAAYEQALVVQPHFAPALESLKEIAKAAQDWDRYAEYLIDGAETCDDEELKPELFVEAARFFQNVREDEQQAARFYQRALTLNSMHFAASEALADIYFRQDQWQPAFDLYSAVIGRVDKSDNTKDYCQKCYRLGYISEKLGQQSRALEFYRQAFEADSTYLPALDGFGQALLLAEQWDEAQKVFQAILVHHREALTESEVVDIQWQIGEICLKQQQSDKAYKQFEKAIEIDGDHIASLTALSKMDIDAGNWEMACRRLSHLGDVAPASSRMQVLLQLSDLAREKLHDTTRSIDALERARRLGAPSLAILESLAQAYLSQNVPGKAVEVLEQAVLTASDASKISELSLLMATVYEQQIKNEPMALQKYNAALDALPTNIKAFEAIERILYERQEWALLEANYRAMIARAKDLSPAIRLVLWRQLAELYRRVLRQLDNAIMAYEVIQKLDPGQAKDAEVLAELYAQKPETRQKAILMQHDVLTASENPVGPLKTLRKLYHLARDFDAVYVVCEALVFLKAADEEEQKIYSYLQRGVPARASRALSEDDWSTLLDPLLNGPIAQAAAAVVRNATDLVTVPPKDLNLRKKDQLDVRQSELYFASMVRYVGKLLNLAPLDVYRKSGSMEPLHFVNAQPPALVAGESNEIFRDTSQRMLLFQIARNTAYTRPEMFLGRTLAAHELRDLLFGMCVAYNRTLKHSGDAREVERWAQAIEKLPAAVLSRLKPFAQAAYPELMQPKNLQDYVAAVDRTATRVGLLAAGELFAVAQGVTEAGESPGGITVRDRIRELTLFAVSKTYISLRKTVGAALVEQ